MLDRLLCDVPDSRVGLRVHHGALCLQSCPNNVQWVDDRRSKGSGCCADDARGDVARLGVVFVAAGIFCVTDAVSILEEFKHAHVDGTIWEHANQPHGDTSVAGSQTAISIHFHGRLANEGAPLKAALDRLALKSKFECVKGIDAESVFSQAIRKMKKEKGELKAIISVTTYWATIPARPPATNFEYELMFLASPWPSKLAKARLVASYDPNLMAVSGMIFTTFNPLPFSDKRQRLLRQSRKRRRHWDWKDI